MKVIALAQAKGGVGKGTIAAHLAILAAEEGLTVAMLDLDRKADTRDWAKMRQRRYAGGPDITVFRAKSQEEGGRAQDIDDALEEMTRRDVDLAILDMPGAFSIGHLRALQKADLVLLPARPQAIDIKGSAETVSAVQEIGAPYAYVFTFVEQPFGAVRAEQASCALRRGNHLVCPHFIARRQIYHDAYAAGSTVMEGNQKRDSADKATAEMQAVWAWVKQEMKL